MRTSTKMVLSFAVIAIITLAIGAIGYYGIWTVYNDLEETESSILPKIQNSLVIKEQQNVLKTAQRTILISGLTDDEIDGQLEIIQESLDAMKAAWAEYEALEYSPEETVLWEGFVEKWNIWAAEDEAFVELVEAYKKDKSEKNYEAMKVSTLTTIRQSYYDLEDAIDKIIQFNENEAAGMKISSGKRATTLLTLTTVGIVAGCVLVAAGIIIVLGLNKTLLRVADRIGESSGLVASAAVQLATSSQQLSEGAAEQAASIEETSATMEETASMVKQNAENTRKANDFSKQANEAAAAGASKMQDMTKSMDELKKSSGEISKIIKVIDEIAFQTNMLALNAAVEAARAGDAGLGFAVVAEEVRNLAQKSAQAAKDTAEIIDRNIELSESGVFISEEIGVSLKEIMEQSNHVNQLMAEIASASEEQSRGTSQVSDAIGQMEQVVQSNAATAEESAAASEELRNHAQGLKAAFTELNKALKGKSHEETSEGKSERNFNSTEKHYLNKQAPKKQIMAPDDVIPMDEEDDF